MGCSRKAGDEARPRMFQKQVPGLRGEFTGCLSPIWFIWVFSRRHRRWSLSREVATGLPSDSTCSDSPLHGIPSDLHLNGTRLHPHLPDTCSDPPLHSLQGTRCYFAVFLPEQGAKGPGGD